jgi:hypothetical protein
MDTSEINEIRYDNLFKQIIERFEPAKRLWPVRSRLLLWLALESAILTFVVCGAPRSDLLLKLRNLQYLFELIALITLGALGAALSLRTAIPGREVAANELKLTSAVALISVLLVFREPVASEIRLVPFLITGLRCVGCTAFLAALPWSCLFWAVRRGMPLLAGQSGALIGVAAFSFAFAATRLGCPIDDSIHLLAWHLLPVAAGTALSMLIGITWLRRRSCGRRIHLSRR